MQDNPYETDRLRDEYLVFHFAAPEHQMPWSFGPVDALEYPRRCAELVLGSAASFERVLDLGCAVGRSSLELSARFDEVVGIDYAQALVEAAEAVRTGSLTNVAMREEGDRTRIVDLPHPPEARPEQVRFLQGDACNLSGDLGDFDALLAANLVDRLPDPAAFLDRLPSLIRPGGVAVLTSPYTWLEEFTPRDQWLGGGGEETFQALRSTLDPDFDLMERRDMPFLIREHRRKFQWSVADATVWRRKEA